MEDCYGLVVIGEDFGKVEVLTRANWDLKYDELLSLAVVRWYLYSRIDKLVRIDHMEWHTEEVQTKG